MGHKKAFRVHQASSPPPLLDISQICYWLFIFFTHYFFYEILLCSADGKLHSSVSNNNKLSIQHRNAFNSNGFDCVVLLFRRQCLRTPLCHSFSVQAVSSSPQANSILTRSFFYCSGTTFMIQFMFHALYFSTRENRGSLWKLCLPSAYGILKRAQNF